MTGATCGRWCTAIVALSTAACTASGATQATVQMTNENRFAPGIVEVPVGGTVTWENQGARSHTVTALGEDGEPSGEFASGPVVGTGRFSHTFEEEGDLLYRCDVHADREMVGIVRVGDG